jgi:hypothetical protein
MGEIGTETLRHLALETLNTRYPKDKWLHIFTDGSQIDRYIKLVWASTVNFSPATCHWNNIQLPLMEKSKPYVVHYVC